ncbi:hypothetical protein C6P44_002557 [Monosporozyma unispora]|nr:hypothetical protein C6P44_002557 [Kazachstania unispora]
MHEYPIECIDKTHNIPTISTDTISNNQVIQNNVIEEDVLISFVTITLIWFIVAIIIILSATIISLIATNISFSPIKHNNNISTTSDLEKQALATIQEEGLTESDTD